MSDTPQATVPPDVALPPVPREIIFDHVKVYEETVERTEAGLIAAVCAKVWAAEVEDGCEMIVRPVQALRFTTPLMGPDDDVEQTEAAFRRLRHLAKVEGRNSFDVVVAIAKERQAEKATSAANPNAVDARLGLQQPPLRHPRRSAGRVRPVDRRRPRHRTGVGSPDRGWLFHVRGARVQRGSHHHARRGEGVMVDAVNQSEPTDAFGAHILTGILGKIDDREIGVGHVVLSEERYAWLLERARTFEEAAALPRLLYTWDGIPIAEKGPR